MRRADPDAVPAGRGGELLSYRRDLPMSFGVARVLRRWALTSRSSLVAYVETGQLRCAFGSFRRVRMGMIEVVDKPIISQN
jgi:hypothetical protein